MGKPSEAQRIEQMNEASALHYFEQTLEQLRDPRRRQGQRYPLRTVVVTALMAMVCGCDDAEAMEAWSEANAEWLGGFLELPHGPPSQDVYLAVFGALDPAEFSAVFQRWAALVSLGLGSKTPHIAIDGKTSRGSASAANGKLAIHTVSAWMCGAGLVLGQVKTSEKSNEIVVVPEILRALDLKGAVVSIDAMGCQREIAATIVDGGGDYLLAVKSNQPLLHREVRDTFHEVDDDRPRSIDETPRPVAAVHEEADKGHARIEVRKVRVVTVLDWIMSRERWKNLSYVIEVRRERTQTSTGKTTSETAYYIGSGTPPSPSRAAQLVRGHWGIENQLHWVLDMAFNEDRARHRARNAAANMTTLRHFALSIITRDTTRKLGIANARKRAGFDRNYLVHLMSTAAS